MPAAPALSPPRTGPAPSRSPQPQPPAGELNWVPELCRGVAAAMVVLAHYYPFFTPQGGLMRYLFTGVDFFFVLSGFVFAPYLVAQRPLRLGEFYVRRLFRLYPLYLLALAAYALVRAEGLDVALLAKHVLMLHTLESREIAFALNPAFWSLPPEVAFYLVLPLMALLCRRRGGLAGLTLLSLLLWWLSVRAVPHWGYPHAALILSVHLPALLVEFLLGVLAYAVLRRGSFGVRGYLLLLAAGLLVHAVWGPYVAQQLMAGGDALLQANPLTSGTVGGVAAAGYALLVLGLSGLATRAKAPRALVRFSFWIGGTSYGVYLFHSLPPLLLEGLVSDRAVLGGVCALLTLAAAAALHRWYEAPLRAYGRDLAERLSPVAAPRLKLP